MSWALLTCPDFAVPELFHARLSRGARFGRISLTDQGALWGELKMFCDGQRRAANVPFPGLTPVTT
jgi:hypothetical protein